MKNDKKTEYITRDSVLKLLSDEEVAKVSTAETAVYLSAGDEYLDLENLDRGVQRAPATETPMGRVLPKKAVHKDTWDKIVAKLAAPLGATSRRGA